MKTAPLAGLTMVMLSLLGGAYLFRFMWRGLADGFVPGSMHATHPAWSASYCVSLFGCAVGIAFSLFLALMGLRHAGLVGRGEGGSP